MDLFFIVKDTSKGKDLFLVDEGICLKYVKRDICCLPYNNKMDNKVYPIVTHVDNFPFTITIDTDNIHKNMKVNKLNRVNTCDRLQSNLGKTITVRKLMYKGGSTPLF